MSKSSYFTIIFWSTKISGQLNDIFVDDYSIFIVCSRALALPLKYAGFGML